LEEWEKVLISDKAFLTSTVRKAPQTATCNACHGNAKLFLTEKDVKPEELQANKAVIVTQVPPAR